MAFLQLHEAENIMSVALFEPIDHTKIPPSIRKAIIQLYNFRKDWFEEHFIMSRGHIFPERLMWYTDGGNDAHDYDAVPINMVGDRWRRIVHFAKKSPAGSMLEIDNNEVSSYHIKDLTRVYTNMCIVKNNNSINKLYELINKGKDIKALTTKLNLLKKKNQDIETMISEEALCPDISDEDLAKYCF